MPSTFAAIVVLVVSFIPLIFGILFLNDIFNVTDDIKYGVGITILSVGGICFCISCVLLVLGKRSSGGDTSIIPRSTKSNKSDVDIVGLMLAVQSGMNLTKNYNFKDSKNKKIDFININIDKELLIKMLRRENELRLSSDVVQKLEYEAVKYYDNNNTNRCSLHQPFLSKVVNSLQKQVVNEFGFINKNEEEHAIEYLRSACALYPDDSAIKNSANYLKYNSVKAFQFNVDDIYKDINLLNLNCNIIKLSNILKHKDVLNVIISGKAHAKNEWPIRNKKEFAIKQHTSNKERIDLAKELQNKYGMKMPIFVDTMNNEFMNIYSGWPLQVLLIFNDKIKWNIKPKKPGYFDLNDLKIILENFDKSL